MHYDKSAIEFATFSRAIGVYMHDFYTINLHLYNTSTCDY